eukprot:1190085-Prorocentrum_minimum.AAC.1
MYHYVSAALQIYVLDEDAMTIIEADKGADGKGDSGVVRMFKQCLETLVDLVGRLERRETGKMKPQEVITVRHSRRAKGTPPVATLVIRLADTSGEKRIRVTLIVRRILRLYGVLYVLCDVLYDCIKNCYYTTYST